MKKIFYVLIFTSFAIFSETSAADDATEEMCRGMAQEAEVEILTSYGKLRYDFSKNNRNLTRMHLRQYGGRLAPGKHVHGLATYDLATEVSFKLYQKTFADGSVCLYPYDIVLSISVQNPTIYISKDLEENSCTYQLAMHHEQTHQQINQEVLESYLPIIKSRFLETVKAEPFVSSPNNDINMEAEQEDLKERYFSVLNPLLEEIKNEIQREQAKLDSAENYDYEQTVCRVRDQNRR